jgi:hypothetical protein
MDRLEGAFRKGKPVTPFYLEMRRMLVSHRQQATATPVDEPDAMPDTASSIKGNTKSVASKRKDDQGALSRPPRKRKNG